MFEGLRKKLSDAVKGFAKKEEKKAEETPKVEEKAEKRVEEKPSEPKEEIEKEAEQPKGEAKEVKEEPKIESNKEHIQEKRIEKSEAVKAKMKEDKKKEDIIKLSLGTRIKSVFISSIRLSDSEIEDFLDAVRISMLESDVSYSTTEYFIDDLHAKLKEKQINAKKIREEIVETVRSSLLSVLYSGRAIDIFEYVKVKKESKDLPVKMLFLGPNGAGKTTTIAKMAHSFKSKGFSSVLSASDTFRAAAIEQIEHHAKKIGVPIIKSAYGADPASIAFDAIAYARARNIDLVLMDSAGRQETNKSLINEVQKIVRVAKPDVTIFVGESTSGNQIAEQIKEFNKFVKIDGIILTKLDCDAKGGGALSISHATGIPILFFGIGEGYDAIMPYDPNYIVDAILPKNS